MPRIPDKLWERAVKIRNLHPSYDGDMSPAAVLADLADSQLEELQERRTGASEARLRMRQRLDLEESEEAESGAQSEAESKQAELKDKIL